MLGNLGYFCSHCDDYIETIGTVIVSNNAITNSMHLRCSQLSTAKLINRHNTKVVIRDAIGRFNEMSASEESQVLTTYFVKGKSFVIKALRKLNCQSMKSLLVYRKVVRTTSASMI